MEAPPILLQPDQFTGWMTVLHTLLVRPVPEVRHQVSAHTLAPWTHYSSSPPEQFTGWMTVLHTLLARPVPEVRPEAVDQALGRAQNPERHASSLGCPFHRISQMCPAHMIGCAATVMALYRAHCLAPAPEPSGAPLCVDSGTRQSTSGYVQRSVLQPTASASRLLSAAMLRAPRRGSSGSSCVCAYNSRLATFDAHVQGVPLRNPRKEPQGVPALVHIYMDRLLPDRPPHQSLGRACWWRHHWLLCLMGIRGCLC